MLLIKDADCIATMDDQGHEWHQASILIQGHEILAVGPTAALPPDLLAQASHTIDARGHVVIPGLVNTHNHMFQSLTRAVPAAQNAELFGWLRTLYPMWARLTPEMIHVSTQVAMAELLLSGCTTSSDHLYLYPNGIRLDDSIAAAREIGNSSPTCDTYLPRLPVCRTAIATSVRLASGPRSSVVSVTMGASSYRLT